MTHNSGLNSLNENYSVGVVGCGHIATHYHLPILDYLDSTSISFVSDIDPAAAEQAASTYSTTGHEMTEVSELPECDVVLLAIPITDREPYFTEFGERETAIFSEKPFAINRKDHEHFLKLAQEVTCNYTRMEYSSSAQMASLIDSGVFGEIERVAVRRGTPQKATGKDESQIDPRYRGGLLHEHGTHLFSQLLWPLHEYELDVDAADVTWNRGIDIDVSIKLVATNGEEQIPVEFEFSLVRHLGREIRFDFENASVWYDPSLPDARVEVGPRSEARRRTGTFELGERAPRNHHQAMAARWNRFLASVESSEIDVELQTGSQISGVITDIYDTVGRWPEGTG